MIINEVKFDVDFTDADFLQKIEEGSKKVFEETEKNKNNQLSVADGIRKECEILKDFIDYILGENASEMIFKGKNSLNLCLKAFEDIINERDKQIKNINEFVNKYSPSRIQR